MSANSCKIKDYSRINPNTGAGFILKRLYEMNGGRGGVMTKREVYEGTHYGHWMPGYHSSIWAKLLEDGLISPWNGFMDVSKSASPYVFSPWTKAHVRAKGAGSGKNYTVRYFITELGQKVLNDMNARRAAVKKSKQEFCARNGVQFGTDKSLPCPLPYTHATNAPVDPMRTPESGPKALDKLECFEPGLAERLDNIIRELQEIRYAL